MVNIALYGGKRCIEVQQSSNVELADCDTANKQQLFSLHPGIAPSTASIHDSEGNCMGYDADSHGSDANIVMQSQSEANGCTDWQVGGGQIKIKCAHQPNLEQCIDVGSGGNVATGRGCCPAPGRAY
jgi:hypothetical protein